MQSWQLTAVATCCAEKVSPIIRAIALPDTWETSKKALEFCWRSCAEPHQGDNPGCNLIDELEAVPELKVEYPDSLSFIATIALNFFLYSIRFATSNTDTEKLDNVEFSLMLETFDSIDTSLSGRPDHIQNADTLYEIEKNSQLTIIKILQENCHPTDRTIDLLKEESRIISNSLCHCLPDYIHSFTKSILDRQ